MPSNPIAIDIPDVSIAVKSILLADPTIQQSAVVAVNRLPEGVSGNSIVLWVVSSQPWNHLEGGVGVQAARIQLDAYSDSPANAAKLAWLITRALDGLQGVIADVQILGSAAVTAPRQLTERVEVGSGQYRFVATQDFRLTFNALAKVVT